MDDLFKPTEYVFTEKQIQDEILGWLLYNGYFVWRNNTGSLPVANAPVKGAIAPQKQFRRIKVGYKGSADIIGLHKDGTGRFIAIEVKSKKGKQSVHQKIFEAQITRLGGIYILAKSLDDVKAILPERQPGEEWRDLRQTEVDFLQNPGNY